MSDFTGYSNSNKRFTVIDKPATSNDRIGGSNRLSGRADKELWIKHFLDMAANNHTGYQQLYPVKPMTSSYAEHHSPATKPTVQFVSPIAQQEQQAAETLKRQLDDTDPDNVRAIALQPSKRRNKKSKLIPNEDIFG